MKEDVGLKTLTSFSTPEAFSSPLPSGVSLSQPRSHLTYFLIDCQLPNPALEMLVLPGMSRYDYCLLLK